MADKAREWTDKELAKMERKIAKTYKQAEKELTQKWNDYMEKGQKRLSKLQNAYTEALKVGDEQIIAEQKKKLQDAMESYTLKNDHYKDMVNSVTRDIAEVNQQALTYVNNELPNVYIKNHGQVLDSLKGIDIGESFTFADEWTVRKMIKDGNIKLPKKTLDVAKDQRWNTKKINGAVLQGILQGEPLDKIADRLLPIVGNNEASARRNARTLMTGAENQGRLDSYEELSEQGMVMKKVWIATPDNHTRISHLELDGEEVEIDEAFSNGCQCPGDPDCDDPAEVWNCRCSMRSRLIGFRKEDGSVSYIDTEHKSGLHDEQIAKEVERRKEDTPQNGKKEIAQEDDFVSKMKEIQDRIEQNGMVMANDIMDAGKIMQKEMNSVYDSAFKEYEIAQQNIELAQKEVDDAEKIFRNMMDKEKKNPELGFDKEYREQVEKARMVLNEKMEARYKMIQAAGEAEISGEAAAKMLRDKLSEIREIGINDLDIKTHLKNSRSPMYKFVEQAYDNYPTSWIQKSINYGKLSVKKTDRGYYDSNGEIAISGFTDSKAYATAIHELGHRFEDVYPKLLGQERQFYTRRTAGEELEWLGSGYGSGEMTRKDDFINAYMGKDYGGSGYELVSMGFQYAYTEPMRLAEDQDMQQWIFGLLSVMP